MATKKRYRGAGAKDEHEIVLSDEGDGLKVVLVPYPGSPEDPLTAKQRQQREADRRADSAWAADYYQSLRTKVSGAGAT